MGTKVLVFQLMYIEVVAEKALSTAASSKVIFIYIACYGLEGEGGNHLLVG